MESMRDVLDLLQKLGDRLLDWLALLLYGPNILRQMSRRFA